MIRNVLAAAMLAAILVPTFALAQDATVVVTEPTLLQQILDAALPTVLTLVGAALLMIINSVAGFIKDRFGIEIEAKHREALHSALITGLRLALVRLGWVPGTPIPQQAVNLAVAYAGNSVPDAINALQPTRSKMEEIAESKAPEVAAEIAASGPEAVTVNGR